MDPTTAPPGSPEGPEERHAEDVQVNAANEALTSSDSGRAAVTIDECATCCASWDETMEPWHNDWCEVLGGSPEGPKEEET